MNNGRSIFAQLVEHLSNRRFHTLAGGALLQVDKAASADKGIFRRIRKRGAHTDLDGVVRLLAPVHRQKTSGTAA